MQISSNAILIKWWRVQISSQVSFKTAEEDTAASSSIWKECKKKNLPCTKSEEIEGYILLFASCQHNSFTFLLFNTPHFACDFLFPLVPPPSFLYGEGGDPESIPVLCMGLPDNLGNNSTWNLNAHTVHPQQAHIHKRWGTLKLRLHRFFAPESCFSPFGAVDKQWCSQTPSDKHTTDGGITWCHISTAALF